MVRKVTVRDKLLGMFHFLTRKKSSKKENLSEVDNEIANSVTREAEAEEDQVIDEKVSDFGDKQEVDEFDQKPLTNLIGT